MLISFLDTVIASTESTSGLKDDEPLDQTHRISEGMSS